MKKEEYLKEIATRLPKGIIIQDETPFEFTDDEFISILSWIKYFNSHYNEHGKEKDPNIIFPIISKRLRLDFGLYRFPCDIAQNRGMYVIYLSQNEKLQNGIHKNNISIKELIIAWNL